MAWVLLVFAGLLEICWAVGLKYTEGFTRPWPTVLTVSAMAVSMILLAQATKTLPVGTAYAIWVGIGAAGAVILGVVLQGEALSPMRAVFLVALIGSIVGLKVTA